MEHAREETVRGRGQRAETETQRERERNPEMRGQRHGGWGTKTQREMETGSAGGQRPRERKQHLSAGKADSLLRNVGLARGSQRGELGFLGSC